MALKKMQVYPTLDEMGVACEITYIALADAVLDEIPDQLVDIYYEKRTMPGEDADGYSIDQTKI